MYVYIYICTLFYSTRLAVSFKALYASEKLARTESTTAVQSHYCSLEYLSQNGCLFIFIRQKKEMPNCISYQKEKYLLLISHRTKPKLPLHYRLCCVKQ